MPRRTIQPGPKEQELIVDNLRRAHALVIEHARIEPRPPIDPPTLDTTYTAWTLERAHSDEGFEVNLDAFAIAFGQYLVERLAMKWVVISDSAGTDLAVYSERGEILLYPQSMVKKRFAARQTGFFHTTYVDVKKRLDDAIRKSRRPWWRPGRV